MIRQYDQLGNNPTEAELRQITFSNNRRRGSNEEYTSLPLLPTGYIQRRHGVATHQDYQPHWSKRNLSPRNYRDFIWYCKSAQHQITSLLKRIYNTFTTKVTKYMNKDTRRTSGDPNNNVYLAIHWGNLLIQDLCKAPDHISEIIDQEVHTIYTAQADLGYELPENYSSPWHLDPDKRRLINNATGYYQDP